jgi:predicted DNA-binding transcriptional regulator YafY
MRSASHDTLVYRLAGILIKLNQGESLDPTALANEFGVNLRTIQRDLNVRFGYLPILKNGGRYRLDPLFLGKFNARDIERFASLAGVRGLFPSFSDEFLRDIFDSQVQSALLVKGHHYEDLTGREPLFQQLKQAIVENLCLSFSYVRGKASKLYDHIEPYRLVNLKGIWYLAACDQGKLKTFSITRIEALTISRDTFTPDPSIAQKLADEDGIWFTETDYEVVLMVAPEAAGYFKRRKLIANQVIEKELQDGSLLVSARVGHPNQILPIVRYWIPHLRILSPESLQTELKAGLSNYLNVEADR